MSVNLCDIVKFTKLIGCYDADAPGASIRSHFTRLELYADVDSWDDKTKLSVATSTIKGRAFDHLVQANYSNYISFKNGIIDKFDHIDDTSSLNNQLFALRQDTKTIREHSKNFDIILNKLSAINAPILPPEILMNIFVDGISFQYKRDILLRGITTYDQALKRAILMERLDTTNRSKASHLDSKDAKLTAIPSSQESSDRTHNRESSNENESKEQNMSDLEKKLIHYKNEIKGLKSKLIKMYSFNKNLSCFNKNIKLNFTKI